MQLLYCRSRPFSYKKINNEQFCDNPGFLGCKVNISFLNEILPYSQICGKKWVRPKKRRLCDFFYISNFCDYFGADLETIIRRSYGTIL